MEHFTSTTRRRLTAPLVAAWLAASGIGGCRTVERPIMLPTKHSVRSEQLLVLSDFKLPKDHALLNDLTRLRQQVSESLNLPLEQNEVVVYLFSNEEEYAKYIAAAYPQLPHRRAYFVGRARELAVYTYWGDRIQEDLRHEYTHGLLHGSLKNVPLWIDEGLAEYFEVAGPEPGELNTEYTGKLAAAVQDGWPPDIERLESIEEFAQMERVDYQEAWAWVHFMLHSTPQAKEALHAYLRDLQSGEQPTPLSVRLGEAVPDYPTRFRNYLVSLPATEPAVGVAHVQRGMPQ